MPKTQTVSDRDGKPLLQQDCVAYKGDIHAVIGLSEVHHQNIVCLGHVVGGEPEYPWCALASEVERVDV